MFRSNNVLLFIFLLLGGVACASTKSLVLFDPLIDKSVSEADPSSFESFSKKRESKNKIRYYNYNYEFKKSDKRQHYLIMIAVSRADNALLNDMRMNKSKDMANYKIGKFVKKLPSFFGPGGASWGMEFVTTDERFHVRLLVSNLLPAGVNEPDISIEAIAKQISQAYDAQ